ncbi:MAG: zinc-dependent metalloprotease [Saprospiraceae bacterium]|jgi:hypothetical protein|nr:zinc-dependent metalloprotease [Saprospiraceae bacterium]MBP9209502.1 zinc-dependent metalloprotease [Saprospiraceae bacterium]
MKCTLIHAILFVMIASLLPAGSHAQAKKRTALTTKAAEAPKDSTKTDTAKKPSIADLTKSSHKTAGFLSFYQDTVNGEVKVYIEKGQLGEEFLYQSFSIAGPAELFLNQNMLRETWLFRIRKRFDRLEWVRSNHAFHYDPASPISRAANVDVPEALFYSGKIEAEDSLGYLIKADDLFISEKLDPVKPFLPPNFPQGLILNLGSLSKEKSSYELLRSFPANADVVVNLAYENASPQNFGGVEITDARYITVRMQHSFVRLPKTDYRPRFAHPHVGYFTQEMEHMTTTEIPRFYDFINRWYLVKKDPGAALSEPVEPIVFWVENTTPLELRQTVLDAGHRWNEAFEAAGFKNAVVMKMMPDDADWDPADIRYNVIRWVSSDLGFAIGPSFVNPRTGQILGADITIDFGFLRGLASETDLYEKLRPYLQYDPSRGLELQQEGHSGHQRCMVGQGLSLQQSFAQAALSCLGDSEEEKKTLLQEFITELVLHEMGHTLGLSHNMKASNMLSPEQLKDRELTSTMGVIGSVMDYSTVNVSLDRTRQANYYSTRVGPYDKWAIRYGYTPFAPQDEEAGLRSIASASTDPKLIFGNDADIAFPGGGIDPRTMVWDLSNDMVAYADERFELVERTMAGLLAKFSHPDRSYENLNIKYYSLQRQRFGMAMAVSGFPGGVYVDRSFPGQQSGNKPYMPVDERYQRAAIELLSKRVFAPEAFDTDKALYNYLQRQRRGFRFFYGSEDPKIDMHILGTQAMSLVNMLNPWTLRRLHNSALYGNAYTLNELLEDLEKALFSADWDASVRAHRKNLQHFYVGLLTGIFESKGMLYTAETRAGVFQSLRQLKKKLKKHMSGDAATQAHRKYLYYQIDRTLKPK